MVAFFEPVRLIYGTGLLVCMCLCVCVSEYDCVLFACVTCVVVTCVISSVCSSVCALVYVLYSSI